MRKLLLIALLISGWVGAQEIPPNLEVILSSRANSGIKYIADTAVTKPWGADLPFEIVLFESARYEGYASTIGIQVNITDYDALVAAHRPGLAAVPGQLPILRYWANGDPRYIEYSVRDMNQFFEIAIQPHWVQFEMQWYWPNVGQTVNGIQTVQVPTPIGGRYSINR